MKKKKLFKKCKVEHVLFYHFLNDDNQTRIVSPGKKKLNRPHVLNMNEWKQLLLYLYLCKLEEKKLEITF